MTRRKIYYTNELRYRIGSLPASMKDRMARHLRDGVEVIADDETYLDGSKKADLALLACLPPPLPNLKLQVGMKVPLELAKLVAMVVETLNGQVLSSYNDLDVDYLDLIATMSKPQKTLTAIVSQAVLASTKRRMRKYVPPKAPITGE